jgi:hypothetical protein
MDDVAQHQQDARSHTPRARPVSCQKYYDPLAVDVRRRDVSFRASR